MLYSFGIQFLRLIALIQASRQTGSVGKQNNFIFFLLYQLVQFTAQQVAGILTYKMAENIAHLKCIA